MKENEMIFACLSCGRLEVQAPLLALRFNGEQVWICSQCLPILIHNPHRLTDKLQGFVAVAGVQIDEHHH